MKNKLVKITLLFTILTLLANIGAVNAKTETLQDCDSGVDSWVYPGPDQDYYVETYWKWTWRETHNLKTDIYKVVWHYQETNQAVGDDGKRYNWHNKDDWMGYEEGGTMDFVHVTRCFKDPWGYRDLEVYRYANGEVRVNFFRVLQEP